MAEVFVVAGEQSGDAHAAALLSALSKTLPGLSYSGVVGAQLRAMGVREIAAAEDLAVMGFSDVIKALPRILRLFYHVRDTILKNNPHTVLLVDAATFNLRMAKALRKKGYQGRIVQYISPTVWAWGAERKKTMSDALDLLLSIYPFEKDHFADTPLRVEYVGNPLIEKLRSWTPSPLWRQQHGIPVDMPLISLFPGSRSGEILRNLPMMLEAAKEFRNEHAIAISLANPSVAPLIHRLAAEARVNVAAIPSQAGHYDLIHSSKAALAKSGTVTLELALLSCPSVVAYKLSLLNKWMAKYILKLSLPHYCIVNILAKETVFPELIARQPTSIELAEGLDCLLNNKLRRDAVLQGCEKVKNLLSNVSASENAAAMLAEPFL